MTNTKNVKGLICHDGLTVAPEARVAEVLSLLRGENQGATLVTKAGRVLGLVTARECVFAALRYRNLTEVAAAELMYSPIPVARAETHLAEIYAAIAEHGICHLAVVDAEGNYAGLIGADDCWTGLSQEIAAKVPALEQVMTREVVTVKEHDSLMLAIRKMARHGIGCVVVEHRGIPVGLLAVEDIAPLLRYGVDLVAVPVSARMNSEVPGFPWHGEGREALLALTAPEVRRLVVVDGAGRIAGLLSRHDLLKTLGQRTARERLSSAPLPEPAPPAQEAFGWRTIADAGDDAMAVLDHRGRVVNANLAFSRLIHRESSAIQGHPLTALLNARGVLPKLWTQRESRDLFLADHDPRNPFAFAVSLHSRPLDSTGLPAAHSLLKIRDLSQHQRFEERNRLWGALLEHASEGLLIASEEGEIIEINHAFCHITGCRERDLLGLDLHTLAQQGHAAPLFRALAEAVSKGLNWRGTAALPGRDGGLNPYQLQVIAVAGDHTAPARFLVLSSALPRIAGHDARPGIEADAGPVRMETQLRQAIAENELSLCYQPQVEIEGGRVIGIEAVVRWNHSERGMIAPDAILPTAERGGFMPELDRWVLRQACVQGRQWLDAGVEFGRMTVNVAETHLRRPGFADGVRQVLEETGLPGKHLELDISETVLITQGRSLVGPLEDLRKLGVDVAIDDFGTGHTSLALLASLPVQRLKLDRGVLGHPRDMGPGLTRAAIAVGRNLGLGVIAKGVEAEWQRDEALEGGCAEAQGFLYGKPAPAEEITRLLMS